jgi:hypothetical protein
MNISVSWRRSAVSVDLAGGGAGAGGATSPSAAIARNMRLRWPSLTPPFQVRFGKIRQHLDIDGVVEKNLLVFRQR